MFTNRSKEPIIHFYYMRPHLNYCNQLSVSPFKDDVEKPERIWQRAIKTISRLQHIVCEEKLRYLDLLTGNNHKLQLGRFKQGIMNIFSSMGMLENCSPTLRLHRGVVEFPLIGVFRT